MNGFGQIIEWANQNEGLLQGLAMLGGLSVLLVSLFRQRAAEAASKVRTRLGIAGVEAEERPKATAILATFSGQPHAGEGLFGCDFDRVEDAVEAALAVRESLAGSGSIQVGEVDLELAPGEAVDPGTVVVSAAVRRALLDENWLRVRAAPSGVSFPFLVEADPHRSRAARRPLYRALVPLAGVVLLTGGVGFWRLSDSAESSASVESLAVLPLANLSGDPAQEFFADGMTETLIGELGRLENIRVISRTSVVALKNTQAPLVELAETLGVDALVEGTVAREGELVRVTARLMHGRDEQILWSGSYERDSENILLLQRDIAGDVARSIRSELSGGVARDPIDPVAHETYFRALQHMDRRTGSDVARAIDYLEEVIAAEPDWALANAKLAEAHWLGVLYGARTFTEARAKVRDYSQKAIDLDPQSPEAMAWYGISLCMCPHYDWEAGLVYAERALAVNPNNVAVRRSHRTIVVALGLEDRIAEDSAQLRALDPLSFATAFQVAIGDYILRRYTQAEEGFARILERYPGHRNATRWHARTLYELGRFEHADSLLRSVERPSAVDRVLLAYGLARQGEIERSLELVDEIDMTNDHGWIAGWHLARVYAIAGRTERALAQLEGWASECRGFPLSFSDPAFDRLREEARFRAVLKKVGLINAQLVGP